MFAIVRSAVRSMHRLHLSFVSLLSAGISFDESVRFCKTKSSYKTLTIFWLYTRLLVADNVELVFTDIYIYIYISCYLFFTFSQFLVILSLFHKMKQCLFQFENFHQTRVEMFDGNWTRSTSCTFTIFKWCILFPEWFLIVLVKYMRHVLWHLIRNSEGRFYYSSHWKIHNFIK